MSDEDKANWLPPAHRNRNAAELDITDIEYLERLVDRGEGLLMDGIFHAQAERLLAVGHAEVADKYGIGLRRIVPTAKGIRLAALREQMKLERSKMAEGANALRHVQQLPPPKGEEK